ncbi:S8 family serine peptidase [Aerosakkonemataceae cyanobacterium BLCC-F46]|uniref:S8 family serine peptidase n=2 Tax=Floridanema TaxID=3396149 RepID=A0ABV4X9W6_9CYAN
MKKKEGAGIMAKDLETSQMLDNQQLGLSKETNQRQDDHLRNSGEPSLMQRPEYVDQQLIVKFKTGVSSNAINALKQSLQAEVVKKTETSGVELWDIKATSVENAIATYRNSSIVEYIEPNYIVSLDKTIPNDPSFNQLWGLNNTGQTGGTADADIDAAEAWDLTTGSDVLVGVIDTGVDYNHPDLVDNIWTNPGEIAGDGIDNDGNGFVDDIHGYDFVNNDGDPFDDDGHGTHVAGTIAASGNNGTGVSGVNWSAKIMGLKFLDATGSGTTFGAIQAVEYSTMMGVQLTNNSWGGGGYSQALYDAIAAAGVAGQLFIAAAGNDSNDNDANPHYPSSYDLDNIIAVASTDHNDQLSGFSNFGQTSVDLAAPGSAIYSTTPGNTYSTYSGTSMATPHVSGVASLLWSQFPGMSATQVKNRILNSVDPIAALDGKTFTGGRLNAFRAIAEVNTGGITGTKWNDQDADGIKDANEPGLANWTIFLDQNNNGVLDSQISTIASNDIPKNIVDNQTVTSNLVVTGLGKAIEDVNVKLNINHTWDTDLDVFLVSPSGTEIQLFTDVGSNGDNFINTILDDEAATSITAGFAPFTGTFRPEGLLSALDGQDPNGTWKLKITDDELGDVGTLNNWSLEITAPEASTQTDANGNYTFSGLQPGTYTIAEKQKPGWGQTFPSGNGTHTFSVASNQIVQNVDFGNRDLSVGLIQGKKWNDIDGDGIQDAGEPGLEGWTVYLDQNNNGTFDQDITNVSSSDVPKSIPDYTPVISQLNVSGLSNAIADVNVTLNINHTWNADLDLFLISPSGTEIELFTDVGGSSDNFNNTTLDDEATTSITAGVAPFSGTFKPEGLLSALDGENANGTWQLKITDDELGDVGTLNNWSLNITTAETSTQTDSNGNYTFTNLQPNTYTVGEVQQSGWQQTFPDGNGTHSVNLAAGEIASNNNFGNQVLPGKISGVKWNDADGDGELDASEAKLSGWTIFLDNNQNGELDAGEISTVTNAQGKYEFTNLAAGTYAVTEVLKPGWIQTSPTALSNPGFETGDFKNWQTLGNKKIETSAFNSGPKEGTYQALLTNGVGSVSDTNLETSLNLSSGSLDALGNGNATEGSVIQRTVTVTAGAKLTFDWNFLTSEGTPSFYNDFSFVAISSDTTTDTISTLANTNNSFTPSSTIFPKETGFGTFSYTFTNPGTYTIGVGVMDVADSGVNSAVLVDNFSLTDSEGNPLPGSHTVESGPGLVVENVNFGNQQVDFTPPNAPIFGTPNNDVLDIFNAPVIVFAGDGNDIVDASTSTGGNSLYGGSGNDELYASTNDRLFGEAGDDILDASVGSGNNRLYGGNGADSLFAGSNDYLFAGNGDDVMFAGSGNNTLIGGSGVDQFWIANASVPTSENVIIDLEIGVDLIGIGGLSGVNSFADISLVQTGDDTRISALGNNLALLKNIQASALSTSNFVFV